MTEPPDFAPDQEIDIEQIMQQIRAQILAQQAGLPPYAEALVDAGGARFSPEFYEHLYQANLAHNQLGVELLVTPVRLPLVGPLLETVRRKLHELVIYYVSQVTDQQRQVNAHLLQALNLLAREFEAEAPAGAESDPHEPD